MICEWIEYYEHEYEIKIDTYLLGINVEACSKAMKNFFVSELSITKKTSSTI